MSATLRAAAVAALIVVSSVAWLVNRTVGRAHDSSHQVVHTQEVLTAIEAVLSTLVDTETAGHGALPPAGAPEPLDGAERAIDSDVTRLAALTSDNPTQRAHIQQLRQDAARTLAALRAQLDAKRASRADSAADAASERAGMDAARATLRAMRREENRLLTERAQADLDASQRLQVLTLGLVAAAAVLLAWIGWLLARAARRQRDDTEALRVAKDDLAAQVEIRSAELRASNERLRSVIDSAVEGIIVIDSKGAIESFNRGAENLFGYTAPEVIGRNVSVLMPSPDHEQHDSYLARYLETGAARIIGIGRRVSGRRRDGTTFPVQLSVGEMTIHGERKFTGILHDMTARMRIEEQLREQASLARLGEMAAVIAHEVKNPLAGVRGAIQVIGTRLPQDSRDAGMIKEVVSRIDALNELMKDLLLFARPPQPKPSLIDLATLVTTTADLLGSDPALKDVSVTVHGTIPPVLADPNLLKIVFVNLLVNGAHAMRGQGTIRVSLTGTADTCQIAFADEGPGIPSEVREKIFTPFFTTKSRGSGLGLPTAKRLIEAHRGNIAITCPSAGGTIVTVELPSTTAHA